MRARSLQSMGAEVRQRIDLNGQQNASFGTNGGYISDAEIIGYLNNSVAEVWDIIDQKFGDNYYLQQVTLTTASNVNSYALPWDFKRVLGIDIALDNTGLNWTSIRPYQMAERNAYTFATSATYTNLGFTSLRYQLQQNNLAFIPYLGPYPNQVRIFYVPTAPQLVLSLPAAYNTATAYGTLGVNVSSSVTYVGLGSVSQVFQLVGLGSGSSGAVPSWTIPGVTTDAAGAQWAYVGPLSSFAQTFDGIAGWEEYPILDTVIKCAVKQERDVQDVMAQKEMLIKRIEAAASNRDAGVPMHVQGGWGALEDGGPFGFGWGFGWT